MIGEVRLDSSSRRQLEFGRRAGVNWWRRSGSAGVPPAIVVVVSRRKTAGVTPALQNTAVCNETCGHESDSSNRKKDIRPWRLIFAH